LYSQPSYRGMPRVAAGLQYLLIFCEKCFAMNGVPMESYLNDPMEVPESDILTQIQFQDGR